DIARGIVIASLSDKSLNEDFNIGTNKETKMIELAKMLWDICKMKESFKVKYVSGFKHDIKRRVPDVSKISKILGFSPEIELIEGLREYVDWYRTKSLK
ncbi:NAD(P)-dependent oxidoreductase, partial [Candidatus Woesearchaeota archaeon]|nr:NAD(P)-dependent oxidoreductase [Candidatus Woesearchaeota archaeon]